MPSRSGDSVAGKRILITGVHSGLGRDLMLHCLERGAQVIGSVRDRGSLEQTKQLLPINAPVVLVVADLSVERSLVDALNTLQIQAESIDIAVLCAGVKHDGKSVLAMPQVRHTFQVNFFSAVELTDWLLGSDSQRSGATTALVLISSIGRWHGMPFSGGYNASKAALSIWGESVAMELHAEANRLVTVTVVEPGMFASAMTEPNRLTRLLFISRSQVAERIVAGALRRRRTIRPPFWFALLTWTMCGLGASFRRHVLARVKPTVHHQ